MDGPDVSRAMDGESHAPLVLARHGREKLAQGKIFSPPNMLALARDIRR